MVDNNTDSDLSGETCETEKGVDESNDKSNISLKTAAGIGATAGTAATAATGTSVLGAALSGGVLGASLGLGLIGAALIAGVGAALAKQVKSDD